MRCLCFHISDQRCVSFVCTTLHVLHDTRQNGKVYALFGNPTLPLKNPNFLPVSVYRYIISVFTKAYLRFSKQLELFCSRNDICLRFLEPPMSKVS